MIRYLPPIFFVLVCSFIYPNNIFMESIPIQDEGRIKPIDTFSRNQLLAIHEKQSIKSYNISAIEWLADILINPELSYNKKVFK